MSWNTAIFFDAFAAVGMIDPAYYWHANLPAALQLHVDLNKPSAESLDQVRDCDYMVEYENSKGSSIKKGGLFLIKGQIFKVSEPPRKQDNGDFSIVDLVLLGTTTDSFSPTVIPWVLNGSTLVSSVTEGPA
jgi:hypothetical protein